VLLLAPPRMMASVLVGTARQYVPIRASCLTKCSVLVKQIHVSKPARRASDDGDLLGVSDEASSQMAPRKPNESLHRCTPTRERNFHDLLQFVRDRTGRVKAVKAGQVRATAWLRLFQLSSRAEHLEAVAEAFSRWRESGKSFSPLDAEMFVRRCEELDCPLLALKVFGDHPKYGLALSSFPAARTLIHSLYRNYPLENTITAVSLLGMNNLAPVTSDPASCAMLYAACLRSKNEHASLLGRDIRVALQKLLKDTKPHSEPKERYLRARYSVKPDLWLLEALRDIKQIKKDEGRGSWWITEWIASGEGRVLPPLSERRHQARGAKHLQDAAMPTTGKPLQQIHS